MRQGKAKSQNQFFFTPRIFCMRHLTNWPMPLTPEQLKTGIAYFTLLAQIQHRLDSEAANKKKLPAPAASIRVTRILHDPQSAAQEGLH
jgi:hypothetical protein